ncbi:glycosyltransferase family 2 protein [Candidatus Peregrinibacteria bacterium]|nr:glycosyltransferase family 2 protein [Candidatus Peregrinibacteria bacterium]
MPCNLDEIAEKTSLHHYNSSHNSYCLCSVLPFFCTRSLSIVIPAYNEERRIGKTLEKINEYVRLKNISTEIIVVSDGSLDHTNEILKNAEKTIQNCSVIIFSKNYGKGFAVQKGVQMSSGKYILFCDADNSTPIEEYGKLLSALKNHSADISIGSRYLADSDVKIRQPKYRIWLGRIGNFLISSFLIDGIKDTQCGFKLFRHAVAKQIFSLQKVKRFGFDMEILAIAELRGVRVIEIPVSWLDSPDSRVRPIKDALITLKDLVYIKLNLLSGRYLRDE